MSEEIINNEKIIPIDVQEEMKNSYIDYAMSVIISRALPDVRDGLKPVHRRILYAMNRIGLASNKAYKKSASVVGEVLGKYHPHGDAAVYQTMVRLAQDFASRYMLVDGHGNFGSVDGDNAAAMRYTEARLTKISEDMLSDIDKDTIEWRPNFDETLKEPVVLPTKIPNLLINGGSGIAVGMATNIPPHNLGEVISGTIAMIDNPEITVEELMENYVKGPDFPTGGIIMGRSGILQAYRTGNGIIKVKGKYEIETKKKRNSIIITEIPYQLNKSKFVESIADLVKSKKIEGISGIRDESSRKGMRIVIELKKDENPEIIINQLYKYTSLQTSFGMNMLALVDNRPKVLGLKEILYNFIEHRKDVVTRRTRFELEKAQKRAHILEGLIIALDNIDEVIKTIRASSTTEEAKNKLMNRFSLTEIQAKAILDMKLQRLTGLEREKIENELNELMKLINYYKEILADINKLLDIIKDELVEIRRKYEDKRRTEISSHYEELEVEDLIKPEDVVVTVTTEGYIKRMPIDTYTSQRRGGKGIISGKMKEDDVIDHLYVASTLDYIMFFTNIGKVYWLKTYKIPTGSRQSKGKAIVNLLGAIEKNEKITTIIPVAKFEEDNFFIMVTKNGKTKRCKLMDFSHPRSKGIRALSLNENDELISVKLTKGKDDVIIGTLLGKSIRFHEEDIRVMGRTAAGVRGIRMHKKDEVVSVEIITEENKEKTLLVITENGYGKRSYLNEYRAQNRGGMGVFNVKTSLRNGNVKGMAIVDDNSEMLLITKEGMIIRCKVSDIGITSRTTQGVRLIRLNEDDYVVTVEVMEQENSNEEENEKQ